MYDNRLAKGYGIVFVVLTNSVIAWYAMVRHGTHFSGVFHAFILYGTQWYAFGSRVREGIGRMVRSGTHSGHMV